MKHIVRFVEYFYRDCVGITISSVCPFLLLVLRLCFN